MSSVFCHAADSASTNDFRTQNWYAWHRDVQDGMEAAAGNTNQMIACAELALAKPAPFSGGELLDFRSAGPCIIPWLIDQMSNQKELRTLNSVVLCLAQFGPEAKGAIPILRQYLDQSGQEENLKITLRIALANLGYRPASMMERIIADLDSTDPVMQDTVQTIALRAIACVGARDWLDDAIVMHINKVLEATGNAPFLALMALGSAGTNAYGARFALARMEERATKRQADPALRRVIGLARYRVDPARPKDLLRGSISYIGARVDPTDGMVLIWANYLLVDEEARKAIIGLLSDPEERVRYGAVRLLIFVGRPAAPAVPRIIELAKEGQNQDLRVFAGFALGTIAETSRLKEVEALLAQEKEPAVKNVLENSVRMIQHQTLLAAP